MKGASRKLRSFRNEWTALRDRICRNPSRQLLHRFRRSCRKWQAVLALPEPGKPGPVCRRLGKDLRRCLRRSRGLRNADVMQKFLRENNLDLTLPFFDKKERVHFCRSLRKTRPGRKKDFRKCTKYLGLEFSEKGIGDKIDLGGRQKDAFEDLAKAHAIWNQDPAHDFSSLHRIRIRLKKIAGQEAFLEDLPGTRTPLSERQKSDLKNLLRHLGKMSDLTLLKETVPELKGTGEEKERLEHILSEGLMKIGKEIEAILGKVPDEHPGGMKVLKRK